MTPTRAGRRRRCVLAIGMALVGAVTSSCTHSRSPTAPTSSSSISSTTSTTLLPVTLDHPCVGRSGGRAIDHVIWIWMENHRAPAVLGAPDAPVENHYATACASTAAYADVGAPSLPNYIGATAGDTFGIDDDGSPSVHPLTADNLFRQVRASGRASRSYEEGMTAPCQTASAGRYAVKHNPAAYYTGGDDRAACERDDVPLGTVEKGALADDLASGALPAFAFVTPDLCNDTHDCPVAQGDRWLGEWLGAVVSSPAYRDGSTAVFVVWDEPTPMPFLAIAPSIAPGTVAPDGVDHFALLRTTEELLGLPLLGAAATATSMRTALEL